MKNGMKKTAAVVMAAMLMGTGAVVPAAEDMGIFSQTAIVAEAASVGKVTGLKSKTLSNSEIQLNWSKVKGASGYTVYMRKNGKYNKLGDCKGTSYTVKKLPNATRENFKVRAYKTVKGKKVYGKYSANWNTATNPQACKGLKVSSVGTDSVKLSWTKIGCTNYRIYQNIKGEWKEIGKTTGTSYTVKKLAPATKYQFKIRACKQDDKKTSNNHYGKYSGVVTATTKKSDKITQADIDAMKKELADFYGNYASEQETADAIAKLYSDTGYVIDPHTAVAAAVYGKYREETYDETKTVIASTASPYKFTSSVLAAIAPEYDTLPVLEQVDKLSALANTEIPRAIEEIRTAPVLHTTECDVDQMPETVRAFLK